MFRNSPQLTNLVYYTSVTICSDISLSSQITENNVIGSQQMEYATSPWGHNFMHTRHDSGCHGKFLYFYDKCFVLSDV